LVGPVLAALTVSLTVAGVPADATTAATTPRPPASPAVRSAGGPVNPSSSHRVTLITGDVVTVSSVAGGGSTVTVDPADPRSTYRTQQVGDDLYVIPDAALPYLASHRLDRDLFDVTGLIDQGYDDASTKTLPLIVEYKQAVSRIATAKTPAGAQRTALLGSLDGAALTTSKARAAGFWSEITPRHVAPTAATFDSDIAKIYLDGKVHADLADSVAQIGAPEAWEAGYDGTGSTVAVLDTGIDTSHPDLADQVTTTQSFVPDQNIDDHNGHGTHVASTIAGTGAASNGVEKGVAPGADLVIGKVLGNDGSGQESWIIDGMEWAATHADIVSMSLGSSEASDGTTPMDQAVDTLSDQTNALFVIAAGNNGMVGGISAPGAADAALTVGAVDGQDQLAYFSNMGPRLNDSALKPDLVAPGVDISAARSHFVDGTGDYQTMSGTSMATPHVAGAAAILAELHPAWTGTQLKNALMSSAKGLDDFTPYEVGTGRVDVPASLGDIHATGSAYFGFFPWPNADATAVDRTVTYSNDGDDPVTLDLAASFRDGAGAGDPAPAGTLAMSDDQVTVPAHGTASVTLTADPSLIPSGSQEAGTVVASLDGAPVARTSIAMDKESERYTLTLRATGRDGQPASTWVVLHAFDDSLLGPVFVDGETTVRLPVGTYSAMAFMDTSDGPDSKGMALLGNPQVDLTQDRVVELDASTAVPVEAKVGRRAEAVATRIGYHTHDVVDFDAEMWMPYDIDHVYASPTAEVTKGDFEFVSRWRLRKPSFDVSTPTHRFDVTQASGGGWLDGTSTLETAYLGTGSEASYAGKDVTGKAVVITRDPSVGDREAAMTALAHGAALLLVVNNAPAEFLDGIYDDQGRRVQLPVGGVSGLEGESLVDLATAGDEITVSGSMNSPWVYDLQSPHAGRIPDDLTYRPTADELTRVDARYYGDKDRIGGEFRFDFRPSSPFASGFELYSRFPQVRTEWVNNPEGTQWVQNASIIKGGWSVRGGKRTFTPGGHATEEWFSPVIHPRLGQGFWKPVRQNDFLQINLPSFGDAGHAHTGGMDPSDQTMRLYHGTKLIKRSDGWQSLNAEVPAKLMKLRVTSDSRRPASWKTSTSSHSVYEFWTKNMTRPGMLHDPILPLVQVNFHVDTDLAGDTRAGRRDTIGFDAWTMPEAALKGTVVGGRLQVSYDDGASWQAVPLTGRTGHWTGHLSYPDNASRFVSLRAHAWDSKGNTVTQEITRAYGLK
jgi:subtilisin family serine protease